jgi:flavin reductase (DIM6/NTAB) family NADH-FMN oxidoreductase RutF
VLSTAAHLAFCRYDTTQEVGYHGLVKGTVERVELGDALDPLVYLQGRFRRLEQPGGRSPSGGVA